MKANDVAANLAQLSRELVELLRDYEAYSRSPVRQRPREPAGPRSTPRRRQDSRVDDTGRGHRVGICRMSRYRCHLCPVSRWRKGGRGAWTMHYLTMHQEAQ